MMHRLAPLLYLVLVLTAAEAHGISVGGIDVPARRGDLMLQGAGLLRKGLVFKIYVGALYLAREADGGQVLSTVPKRLDIHYFRKTPKKHMVRVAERTLRKDLSAERFARHRAHMDALHQAYRDGHKGGYASLIHRPDAGLTYAVNGKTVLTINDDAFANDYFRVWLGDKPSSATMKAALLTKLAAEP